MKKDYIKLCCLVMGVSLILSGVVLMISNIYKQNRNDKINDEKKIVDEILDVYESFKSKTEEFGEKRDIINAKISDYVSYYTGMEENYQMMQEVLTNYETLIGEVEDSAFYLKANCLNETYSNPNANSNCNSYIINFEKIVNTFVVDLQLLNSKIDEYNNWATSENEGLSDEDKHKILEHFVSTKYTDFIDVNNDGTYLGMEID